MLAARPATGRWSKFVILRSLAMGRTGEILLARVAEPARPERLVVLKRLHRLLAEDREYVKMFVDEARLAITLRHPNVVEVHENGEDDGTYYIAMEYLYGHNLRRVLSQMASKRVPMRLASALSIARAVSRGLDYTHERTDASGELLGIVHRDVSPRNMMLTFGGRVKLIDFGIPKTAQQRTQTRTRSVTLHGQVAYMSPEQALSESLDRRSDVFCLGILLWEMTTGRWLYRRRSELETLKALVDHDAPPPSQVIADYPEELEPIVLKALARRREDRWQTAGELYEALSAFAKRRRLDLRPSALAALMSATFSEEVEAWHAARASGMSLVDHLATSGEQEEIDAERAAGASGISLDDLPATSGQGEIKAGQATREFQVSLGDHRATGVEHHGHTPAPNNEQPSISSAVTPAGANALLAALMIPCALMIYAIFIVSDDTVASVWIGAIALALAMCWFGLTLLYTKASPAFVSNAVRGAASVMDIGATFHRRMSLPNEGAEDSDWAALAADREALESDWEVVARDLRKCAEHITG